MWRLALALFTSWENPIDMSNLHNYCILCCVLIESEWFSLGTSYGKEHFYLEDITNSCSLVDGYQNFAQTCYTRRLNILLRLTRFPLFATKHCSVSIAIRRHIGEVVFSYRTSNCYSECAEFVFRSWSKEPWPSFFKFFSCYSRHWPLLLQFV
jgi:hypothetical protein